MKANFFKKKQLLFRAQNKDAKAYSQVYDLYVDKIFRFIYFKVRRQEDAQDLTSEVFLKTWQYIVDGKDVKNINALFYKIARNLVIDHYRKASNKDVPLEREIIEKQEIQLVNIEEDTDTKIKVEQLMDRIGYLKDEYKEIIILRYVEGLSISEIAGIVDKKKGNVRVILFQAVNTLKELMEEEQSENDNKDKLI